MSEPPSFSSEGLGFFGGLLVLLFHLFGVVFGRNNIVDVGDFINRIRFSFLRETSGEGKYFR